VVAACATPPPPAVPARVAAAPALRVEGCPRDFPLAQLLTWHARTYGGVTEVAASLPMTMRGTLGHIGDSLEPGDTTLVYTERADRHDSRAGGRYWAWGSTDGASWFHGQSGMTERVRDGRESRRPALERWLLRREYVRDADKATSATCRPSAGKTWVRVAFAREDLGQPTLTFDADSAELVDATWTSGEGASVLLQLSDWTAPDAHGVRWPLTWIEGGRRIAWEAPTRGAACTTPPWSRGGAPASGDACSAPPPDRTTIEWPASGVVRVPMVYYAGQVLVRARAGGRDVWAALDSGAAAIMAFEEAPLAKELVVAGASFADGSTQRTRVENGELPELALGDLVIKHAPATRGPAPGFEQLGSRRPELLIGTPAFRAARVRIDYAKREVVFQRARPVAAPSDRRDEAPGSTRADLHVLGDRLVSPITIAGQPYLVQVDTGNGNALAVEYEWARDHGLLGRSQHLGAGQFGIGEASTSVTMFSLASGRFGSIVLDGTTGFTTPMTFWGLAGLLGNRVLARCDAIVLDAPARELVTVGTCAHPPARFALGFSVSRAHDAEAEADPWRVDIVPPGGAAARAGLRAGDHVLAIGGRAVTLDNVMDLLETSSMDILAGRAVVRVRRAGTELDVPLDLTGGR
jgi:hypothetical protein